MILIAEQIAEDAATIGTIQVMYGSVSALCHGHGTAANPAFQTLISGAEYSSLSFRSLSQHKRTCVFLLHDRLTTRHDASIVLTRTRRPHKHRQTDRVRSAFVAQRVHNEPTSRVVQNTPRTCLAARIASHCVRRKALIGRYAICKVYGEPSSDICVRSYSISCMAC